MSSRDQIRNKLSGLLRAPASPNQSNFLWSKGDRGSRQGARHGFGYDVGNTGDLMVAGLNLI